MTDKPSEDEKPDDAAFQRTLENMLRTPPKPHAPPLGVKPVRPAKRS